MKNKLLFLFLLISIVLIFYNYNIVLSSSIEAVNIWLNKVFPFLFIMFILNDFILSLNILESIKKPLLLIVLLCLLSGTPSNAYILSSLVKEGKLSKDVASYCLLYIYFMNPLFLFTNLSFIFSIPITIKLIIIHYLSNLIIYLLIKNKIPKLNKYTMHHNKFNLGKSITKSMNTLLMILGTITLFMIITNIISNTFNFNMIITSIIKGLLEVTQGLNSLKLINKSFLKEILATIFISFGGLSIHSQVKTILNEANIKYSSFLKGRIFQTIIALILTTFTHTFF